MQRRNTCSFGAARRGSADAAGRQQAGLKIRTQFSGVLVNALHQHRVVSRRVGDDDRGRSRPRQLRDGRMKLFSLAANKRLTARDLIENEHTINNIVRQSEIPLTEDSSGGDGSDGPT